MIGEIQDKVKAIKEKHLNEENIMTYFYGNEASEEEKKAYRVGALNALDEVYFFLEKLALDYY